MAQTAASDVVYEELIGRLVAWREPRSELRVLAAVGSRAQKEANVDDWSDLDVLIVTTKSGRGIRSRVRVSKNGKQSDGNRFYRGALYDTFVPDLAEVDGIRKSLQYIDPETTAYEPPRKRDYRILLGPHRTPGQPLGARAPLALRLIADERAICG